MPHTKVCIFQHFNMNRREMICYETDASRLRGIAQKVLTPQTIEEVKKIVKSSKFDIVPRGSGTNLVGGVIPNNSIVIDMSKMNRVFNYLPIRKTVRVEAGITLKELNDKLNSVQMEFPIDTHNKGISTIGGMIAINASGDRSMRYGNMREWIEEIEFINGRGELVKTSKADLTDVCGMEGITGVIVGATIKLAPLIKRSASAFQSDNLDEVLSIARKLKVEKEVVVLELLSSYVSKLLGLPEKYNLFIEFNSDRGKIKDKKYGEMTKLRENVFPKLFSEGYYNFEDPKLFFDKLKEFILFLEENNIPYIGHLGVGIIHPFFKDNDNEKREKTVELIKKMKALPGKLGIGLARKYFIDNFAAKLIQRVKVRHDPSLKFNRGKLIDISGYNIPKRVKVTDEIPGGESSMDQEIDGREDLEEDNNDELKPLTGEEISAVKVLRDINSCENVEKKENVENFEKTPEEKMEDFIKEIEQKDKSEIVTYKDKEEESKNMAISDAIEFKSIEEEKISNEFSFQEIKEKLQDYKETYESELSYEKKQAVEEIARNIPREIVKGEKELGTLGGREKVKIDYKDYGKTITSQSIDFPSSPKPSSKTEGFSDIQNIMTNRLDTKNIEAAIDKGKVVVTDNFGEVKPIHDQVNTNRKGGLSDEDRDLVNKILGNRYKK